MTTIQSYDSRRALSAYQIGNAYTFYIQNPNMDHLVKIKASDYESHIANVPHNLRGNLRNTPRKAA